MNSSEPQWLRTYEHNLSLTTEDTVEANWQRLSKYYNADVYC